MFQIWKKTLFLLFTMLFLQQTVVFAAKPQDTVPSEPEKWLDVKSYEERQDFQIDRGEICKYLIQLYGQFTTNPIIIQENGFTDIGGEMFTYILKAHSLGLIQGMTETSFAPDEPITKGEFASAIYSIIQYTHKNADLSIGNSYVFYDSDKIPNIRMAEALSFLFSREIIKASYNGSIGAQDDLTLKETVAILQKVKESAPQFKMLIDSYDYKSVIPPEPEGKKAYLTFDDGVSKNTLSILNTLDQYGVKATFFITGNSKPDIIRQIAENGHAIGNHSYSHDYSGIYAGETAFWADFQKEQSALEELIGYQPFLYRFPGGSNNTVSQHYSASGFMQKIATQMAEKGYVYFDWNVSSGDASGKKMTKNQIVNMVLSGCEGKNNAVILMHQTASKTTTAEALPEIIEGLQKMGFTLLPISENTAPVQFLKP